MSGTKPRSWTETTIESAIDTLANLTSVQGRTVTLADANLDVLFGWDDSAGAYDNFALADITTEGAPADGDFVLIYGAEGDLRKVDWADLPGAGSGIAEVAEDTDPELGGTLNSNNFDIVLEQYSADAVDAELFFDKSRNASIGSHTVVQDGDDLGRIVFRGSDGTNFEEAAAILAEVDGTPGNNDMPGRLTFWTTPDASATPLERMRITQAGLVSIGSGPVTGPFSQTPNFSINASGNTNFDIGRYANDEFGCNFRFLKSRNTTIGSHTVVQDGDDIGGVAWGASDGDEFHLAALIQGEVDGTPGNNDMPGRITFWTTPDASATPLERLRIDQAGRINIGAGDPPNNVFDFVADLNLNGGSGSFSFNTWSTTNQPVQYFARSRNTTVGSHTVLNSGDAVGGFFWAGSDGTDFAECARLRVEIDGTPGDNDMPGRFLFETSPDASETPLERMRIDAAGRVHLGSGAVPLQMFGGTSSLAIESSGSDFGGDITQYNYANNANASAILVHKARSTSFGAVSSGDTLGSIWWAGADGDQWVVGADIAVVVDATPGNNDMPTRMEFGTTADGGTFPTIRLTIKSDGRLVAANGAIPHFWVYWTANSTTILASYNMTSIADTGVGDADGTIATDFSSANWAGHVTTNDTTNGWDAEEVQSSGFNARAAGTFGVLCSTITDGGTAVTSLTDPEQWNVSGLGVSA